MTDKKFNNLIDQHRDDIEVMLKQGVFDYKAGKAVMHRDKDGRLRKVEITAIVYKG